MLPDLEPRFHIILPDLPGHGGSSAVRADLWRTADLLDKTVGGPAVWVGYSMGGRVALHVALAHPEQVQGLVLISTTPGIEGPEGTEHFIDRWLAQPLFRSLPAESADREARLANTPGGLASSLRLAGTGTQGPLWERLAELRERALPVLVVAGELDHKYSEQATRTASAIGPSARLLIVKDAGHACHLEQPKIVSAAVIALAGQSASPTARRTPSAS
jgi:2-succinyl-6-hydroxy-2,4-cyclohexadiene-1-carboxylate synthase